MPVSVPEGTTVLRAAELAGVYVPSLCSHKELTPFGGCRLCTVEIEGARGYPLACSTLVADGMEVTTDTVALREMRQEILRLILSRASLELPAVRRERRLPAQPEDDPQGRRLDRLPELPQRRRLRAAAGRGAGRHHRDRLPDRLPRPRGRARRPVLRPRLQPLHPLRALRAHVPRGARRIGAVVQVSRPADADRARLRHLARDGRLRVLRRLRVGAAPPALWPTRSPSGTASPTGWRPPPARSAAWAAGSSWPTRAARCRRCAPPTTPR